MPVLSPTRWWSTTFWGRFLQLFDSYFINAKTCWFRFKILYLQQRRTWCPAMKLRDKRRWRHPSEVSADDVINRSFGPREFSIHDETGIGDTDAVLIQNGRNHRKMTNLGLFSGEGGELRHFSWILWLGQLTTWCSQSPLFWGCLDCCCQLFLSNRELVRRNPLWRKGKRLWHSQVSASLSSSFCQNAQLVNS